MKTLWKYWKLWIMFTKNSFLSVMNVRFSLVLFLVAKGLRFSLYYFFLLSLFSHFNSVQGYTNAELLFAFMTFVVIDGAVQLFFREVYRFRPMIVSGDFDLVLTKPMNPLFRVLLGGADVIDCILIVPYFVLLGISMVRIPTISLFSVILFVVFVFNSFLIATAFHIIIVSLTIITSEIDHTVMIYRDVTSMGRIPVDIYREPLRMVITYIFPVGIMMTFPVKALLQTLSPFLIIASFGIGIGFFLFALFVWRRTILQYASASS